MPRPKKETTETTNITDTPVEMTAIETSTRSPLNGDLSHENKLGVFCIHDGVKMPEKGSKEASCYDLSAYMEDKVLIKQIGVDGVEIKSYVNKGSVRIYPNAVAFIPTGIRFDIPAGYDVRVYARSGLPLKGLTLSNSVGIIDNDYRGEVKIILHNITDRIVNITNGMRLAQFELHKIENAELVRLQSYDTQNTQRSENGFGSTGN